MSYIRHCKAVVNKKTFTAREHQIDVADKFKNLNGDDRGLLIFHGLGSGKTCTSILSIDKARSNSGYERAYLFAPGSLRDNFVDSYCEFCGANPEKFADIWRIYGYNAPNIKESLPMNLDNSFIVVDEIHNVINAKRNNSDQWSALYDLIKRSKNTKILLLTGTPLFRSVYDIGLIIQLIRNIEIQDEKSFMSDIEDDSYFYELVKGVVSYIPRSANAIYPVVHEMKWEMIMSDYQHMLYNDARHGELECKPVKNKKKPQEKAKYPYFVNIMLCSRMRCNAVYPESSYNDDIPDSIRVDKDYMRNLSMYSPKFLQLLKNVIKYPGKHLIHSFLKERRGVKMIKAILDHCSISNLMYTGGITNQKRTHNLNMFNSKDNCMGKKIKALLITDAGSEGIDVKGCHNVHILEPNKNFTEMAVRQVIGRVVRDGSHAELPPNIRYVIVHRYFINVPNEIQTYSTEMLAYDRSMLRLIPILDYTEKLKRGAYDCDKYGENCYQYVEEDNENYNINNLDLGI
jgi:superfamily II DNA or RNA helicase